MSKSKYDKELEKAYKDLKEMNKESKKARNDLLNFFIGLLMFGGGLFLIFQNAQVTSTWGSGYFYHIGSWGVPNGLILLPLIIGVIMLFMMDRKIFGWIVIALGVIFILLTIIMSVRIVWRTTSVYMFVLMFGLAAAGAGLMLRALFRTK
ncbi:MAG: hypothetical protein IJX77_07775 [Ruminococcus sp.]|nr:hypothetical protein [Ruminococcus sp.]